MSNSREVYREQSIIMWTVIEFVGFRLAVCKMWLLDRQQPDHHLGLIRNQTLGSGTFG